MSEVRATNIDADAALEVPATGTADDEGLRRGRLSLPEVLAQSVGMLTPSTTAAILLAPIALQAGSYSWLTMVVTTVAVLCIAYGLARISRRLATSGGLYAFVGNAAGPLAGFVTASLYAMIFLVSTPALALSFGIYFNAFLEGFGVGGGRWVVLASSLVTIALAVFTASRGIELSARLVLFLQAICILIVAAAFVVVLFASPGDPFDSRQLTLEGASVNGVIQALVVAILVFGGFEASAVYGREARNPRSAVPIAMFGSVIVVGLFYVFALYVTVLAFAEIPGGLAASGAPLGDMVHAVGFGWIAHVVNLFVSLGVMAAVLAGFNAGGRVIYTLSREGLMPKLLGRVHSRNRTPVYAIGLVAGIAAIVNVVVAIQGGQPMDSVLILVTFAGYGLLVVYAIAALTAPIFQYREGRLRVADVVLAAVGFGVIAYALYQSFNPLPPEPVRTVLFAFCGFAVLVLVAYLWLWVTNRPVLARIGVSATENAEDR